MKTQKSKLCRKVRRNAGPGFPGNSGPRCLPGMAALHRGGGLSAWYKIGTESGASLMPATCALVAVGPWSKLERDVSRNRPRSHKYRMTRDDVLARGQLDRRGDACRRARIVLCDHIPSMRQGGHASNRTQGAQVCGAAVIWDKVAGLPDDGAPFVQRAGTADEFRAAVDAILAEPPERRAAPPALAATMVAGHSFDARARAVLSQINKPA